MVPVLFLLAASFLFASPPAIADVITSTTTGGPWHVSGTWLGGIIPDGNDDVIIQGPVLVQNSAACLTLDVRTSGGLTTGFAVGTVTASGAITNAGTIADGSQPLFIQIGGDLTNNGQWTNRDTFFTGAADHHLIAGDGSIFESKLAHSPGATGDVIVETPFAILGDVIMGEGGVGQMVLQPGSHLTMRQGKLGGEVLCNGNELRFESWSYMSGKFDQAVIVGEAEVGTFSEFTGSVTVMDVLQNVRSFGPATIRVEGLLVNNGLIRNDNYGFHVDLYGDLSCNGIIACPQMTLDESTVHHITMGPEGDLQTPVMLPEFVPGAIVVDSDIRISRGITLGIAGTMTLSPGASVHLAGSGSLSGGTVLADGNPILMDGTGKLSSITIDDAVLQGTMQIAVNCAFTDGVVIEGTLQSWPFISPEMTVTGRLFNQGLIQNGAMALKIRARGDVVNEGAFTNARLVIDGAEDQGVEIGNGLAVPEIVFESGLQASTYQWFRDGEVIPGETGSNLTFATLVADDHGSYWCDGDGILSRTISVTANAAGVPGGSEAPSATMLGAARPNPFRGATMIDFALASPAPVRLSAFDVAGRLVAVLVDEQRSAGRHEVPWRADHLAPGVYFLRLEAGSTQVVKKLTRLE